MVTPLAKIIPDHIPYKVSIGTKIPKSNIFRFENFWTEHPGFFELVSNCWQNPNPNPETAKYIASKFKSLRKELKGWSKKLSRLNSLIANWNKIILFFDTLEELRHLNRPEWNFRLIIKKYLLTLLHYKNIYWRKRYTMRMVKYGVANMKFFHAMVTKMYRKNKITQTTLEDGIVVTKHEE